VAVELPALPYGELAARLRELSPEPLADDAVAALAAIYDELRRWSRRLSLIGPGTADGVLERHFGESLAALPLLPSPAGVLVDLGSGAGFPGLVLAAARPGWQVTLVESRERKWAYLLAASRRAALSCRCLNARVGNPLPPGLPPGVDAVTSRALRLPPSAWEAVVERLAPGGRILLWQGDAAPVPPPGLVPTRRVALRGSRVRHVQVFERESR